MARKPNGDRRVIREKVAEHRERLRAKGLRPVQLWVPDMRSEQARVDAERQSRLVDQTPGSTALINRLLRIAAGADASR